MATYILILDANFQVTRKSQSGEKQDLTHERVP